MENTGEKYFTKAIEALTNPEPPLKPLPVASIVPKILESVRNKNVTIVTAETGSGKTLLANAELADASDHPVWVLVPRRFLAINAAETIAKLSGKKLGEEVGYAIGQKATGRSNFSSKSKLIFATYGYALSSNLLDDPNTKTIVCDEVHEKGIDISLARAIIHRRMKEKNDLNVVEMSATINADKQADYWRDVAEVKTLDAPGNSYDCDYRHINPEDKPFNETVRDLVQEVDRTTYEFAAADNQHKGVAVFVEGVGIAEAKAKELRQLFKDSRMDNVEVATIYSDMDDIKRKEALAPPKEGNLKVLIGTNVIESGMNIPWLRAGISNGLSKVPHYDYFNGAEALITEELPQWRITQQEGRVKRFDKGIFVLHSATRKEDRPLESTPDISRISLDGLVMYAANYGINPTKLKFDAAVAAASQNPPEEEGQLSPEQIQAELQKNMRDSQKALMRLQLLKVEKGEDEKAEDEKWKLTESGEYVMSLPLGPEAGAMMSYANSQNSPKRIDGAIELGNAIELAAVAEVMSHKGSITPMVKPEPNIDEMAKDEGPQPRRKPKGSKGTDSSGKAGSTRADMRIGHGEDSNSDVLDALKAYKKVAVKVEKALDEMFTLFDVDRSKYEQLLQVSEPTETDCNFTGGITLEKFTEIKKMESQIYEKFCGEKNMSVMRFKEIRGIIADMHRRLDDPQHTPEKTQPAKDEQLIQMLLHGSVNHLFKTFVDGDSKRYFDLRRNTGRFKEGKFTVTKGTDDKFAIAHLREFASVSADDPMVTATNITRVSPDAMLEFLANRPDILTSVRLDNKANKNQITGRYFDKGAEITLTVPRHRSNAVRAYVSAITSPKAAGSNKAGEAAARLVDDVPELVVPAKTGDDDRKYKKIEQKLKFAMRECCDAYRVNADDFHQLATIGSGVSDEQLKGKDITRDFFDDLMAKQDQLLQTLCREQGMSVERFHQMRAKPPTGGKPVGKLTGAVDEGIEEIPQYGKTYLGGGKK